MPLTIGTRLGPYEIQTPLGAGGMGEVYKARDTRLDRTVAIKVLPSQLATDPQFRERFDREARTIASLNHPHICTLYDVGHERLRPARGAGGERGDAAPPSATERGWGPASTEEDGIDYLVMEYLEGQTLAERLEKGALSLDQTLQYAIQIADALDKAHRKGIVHRDLKPGNIFLCSRGPTPARARHTADAGGAGRGRYADESVNAKLLDFGLAKTAALAVAGADLSKLPTTPNLTAQGTILGTLQYMAPEQLEGKDADARTDIFAFGALLYEMLTGKKAFEGQSQASLISAIMSAEPVPIAQLQPLAPPQLDHVVRRCLAKDPDARWQTSRDLEEELRWVTEGGGVVADAARCRAPRARRVGAARDGRTDDRGVVDSGHALSS